MTDQMALFTMACAAMSAAVVGINNEHVVAMGRLKAIHRKLRVDPRSSSEIANGRAAETANRLAAVIAIASVSVMAFQQIFS